MTKPSLDGAIQALIEERSHDKLSISCLVTALKNINRYGERAYGEFADVEPCWCRTYHEDSHEPECWAARMAIADAEKAAEHRTLGNLGIYG